VARKSAYTLKKGRTIILFGQRKTLAVDAADDGDDMVKLTFTDDETIRRPRTTKFDVA
jgi:hypothetical protein